MNAPDLFSKTYAEARSRFIEAASANGFEVTSEVLPIEGPAGEELAMDFAVGGPADAASALVVISGTHGPEGYTGSACQLGFLESSDLRNLFSTHRVVLVHAHNPFGFAWMRRTTEGNVDLNRNYVDFNSSLRGNPEYDRTQRERLPSIRSSMVPLLTWPPCWADSAPMPTACFMETPNPAGPERPWSPACKSISPSSSES